MVVLGAESLTTAAGAPIEGVTVAGAGAHVLCADGTVTSALAGSAVTVTGTSDPASAKWARNDPQSLIESDTVNGSLRVTNADNTGASLIDENATPAAIVFCIADGSKAPLVSEVSVDMASDRFLAGPNPKEEGSAMYRGGSR